MSDAIIKQAIAALLQEAARAHHQAFIETDGVHDEWAAWYADYMDKRLSTLLKVRLSPGKLTELLISFDEEYQSQTPAEHWSAFYAGKLLSVRN